jgi:hypothetical protein
VLSNLAYLIGAVVAAVLLALVLWLRHRQPKSVDANMASFRRGLSVLAPDPRAAAKPVRPDGAARVRPTPALTHVRLEPAPRPAHLRTDARPVAGGQGAPRSDRTAAEEAGGEGLERESG